MFTLPKNYSLFQKEAVVVLTTIFILLLTSVKAQNEVEPWKFFFGINAVDAFPTGAVGSGDLFEEFLTIDHWNIAPYPSYIGVKNYIGAGFFFEPVSVSIQLNNMEILQLQTIITMSMELYPIN